MYVYCVCRHACIHDNTILFSSNLANNFLNYTLQPMTFENEGHVIYM